MEHLIVNRSLAVSRSALVAGVLCVLVTGACSSATSPSSSSSTATCQVGQVPTNPECTNPANLLTVTIQNGVFSPNPVMVTVGQSVNWLNRDTGAHTATASGLFDTGSIPPTSAHDVPVTFNSVGTFTYQCTLHANETATVVVAR